jgi:molybdopterin-binding protein
VLVDGDGSNVSTRNRVAGTVASVVTGAVNAEVLIATPGGAQLAAIITNDSVERLGLAKGKPAVALFKASSVIVGVEE